MGSILGSPYFGKLSYMNIFIYTYTYGCKETTLVWQVGLQDGLGLGLRV